MSEVLKPIVLIPELGEQGVLPDGGIINAGGTSGPNFTIGGKAVIFADGTASDGSGQVIVTNNSNTVRGYEHVQTVPSDLWVVAHNQSSQRVQVTIWDPTNEMVFSDVVAIINPNLIHIRFNTPLSGRAILMLF